MNELYALLTISEVAYYWRKHYRSVERAIDTGRYPLIARQELNRPHGKWLIDRRSVERRWGNPVIPLANLN